MSTPSGNLSSQEEAQRAGLLRELEQQRRRIDEVLSPSQPVAARLARTGEGGFPRSHTMRLILGEPMLLAALSDLAMRLLGVRVMTMLPVATSVAKAVHAVLKPPAQRDSLP